MNSKASIELEQFSKDFEAFLFTCNDLEEAGKWDAGELGPMAAYFEADLFSVMLQVMCADGVFEHAEAEVINAMFSAEYTPRQLNAMYRSTHPAVDDYCDENAEDALTLLAKVAPELQETYRNLLLDACRIISQSDGVAEKSERMLIAQLQEALS